ncbi:unnamed protein product [Parajaminaea phylloscopi]
MSSRSHRDDEGAEHAPPPASSDLGLVEPDGQGDTITQADTDPPEVAPIAPEHGQGPTRSSAQQQAHTPRRPPSPVQQPLADDPARPPTPSDQGPSPSGHGFATSLGNLARTIWESILNPLHAEDNADSHGSQPPQANPIHDTSPGYLPQVGRATLEPEVPSQPSSASSSNGVPPIVYYTLPFPDSEGRPALLAIPGNFLPVMQVPAQNNNHQNGGPQQGSAGGPGERQRVQITVLAPASPIFLPLGSSSLPFSWLYDASGWGWPIISLRDGQVPAGLALPEDPRHAPFLAGPPFPIRISMTNGPGGAQAEEQPNPERAKTFVDSLETADAELRERMARLGIGDIGAFGGDSDEAGELGCPVCLDVYDETSDRPEWIGGEEAKDQHVVVIPCNGFHSLHRRCLLAWLASKPPSQWNCPMCRSSITPSDLLRQNPHATGTRQTGQPLSSVHPPSHESLQEEIAARSRSLRDEIHRREKDHGYLCDYLACFPDYEPRRDADDLDRSLVTLKPCGHKLHLECLTTSLRVSNGLGSAATPEAEAGDEDEDEDEDDVSDTDSGGAAKTPGDLRVKTVGRWVQCPVDRKEAWALLPVIRRRRQCGDKGRPKEVTGARALNDGEATASTTATESVPVPLSAASENSSLGPQQLCGQVHHISSSPEDQESLSSLTARYSHGHPDAPQAKRHMGDF